jgi:hypothetical protein
MTTPTYAANTDVPADRSRATSLSDEELAMLRLAGEFFPGAPGLKERHIRDRFGINPTRFYQRVNRLLGTEAALAAEPLIVGRLRRIRETRASARRRSSVMGAAR